jgi:hypothetical protein
MTRFMRRRRSMSATAVVAAFAIVVPTVRDGLRAQAAPPKPAASPAPSAASTPPIDGGWPRAYMSPAQAQMLVYQPQIATWDGQKQMLAYAAVSYQAPGAAKPELGTVKLEAKTSASLEERLVRFQSIRISETNFAKLSREQVQDLLAAIQGGIPEGELVIALDRVLANIDKSQIFPRNVEGVKADPPTIFYSTTPAVLVGFDGDPVWSPIKDNDLKFAVNTNWDVFEHSSSQTYYLRNEKVWLKASAFRGPWSPAGKLPDSFAKLPADDNWKDVKASLPGAAADPKTIPTVFVSTQPAELMLLRGNPTYVAVTGSSLGWVSNTESDVFRVGSNGTVYYLVAGRWFSAPGFTGPWTFATQNLPEDFKKISLEHPRSRVLASVPGTPQAAEAVLLATVPQTARVNPKELKGPEVDYQGEPQFQPIEKTTVSRAVNTDKDIIKVGDLYYMCFQGVWFMGRSATGPWNVAETVPKEIYEIPTSSPAHHVTYVTIEEDDDDEWVTFAAVAGYTGMMVAWGCAVWGTGWYYPPYVGYGGFYPAYYPFYPTYGYGAWYNPWTGGYGRGAAVYGPYGGAGVTARYNPRTGTYSRGAVAWGPYGARGAATAYNPRTGAYGRTQQGSGVYGSWGSTSVQRGNQWAQTARVTNRVTGTTTRATRTSGGGEAVRRSGPQGSGGVARTGSGDVYAGRDGNVYRRQDGSWQKYDNGSWGSVNTPQPRSTTSGATTRPSTGSETVGQLDRDRAARSEGTTRTRDYSSTRSSSGSGSNRATGSYRPSGGARTGGGGMRAGGGRRR